MKYIKLLIVFILFISIPKNCLASTNTLTRTREKPLVPDRVIVDENNIDEILLTPAVSSNEKIYDFAELYTEEEEKKLSALEKAERKAAKAAAKAEKKAKKQKN